MSAVARTPGAQGAIFVAALLALWEVAAELGWLRPFQFPPPSRIAAAMVEMTISGSPDGTRMWTHVIVTMGRVIQGFLIAIGLAIPIGLVIGRSAVIDAMLRPVVTFSRSVATLSLLPLVIIWFGIGELSKILLIAYACFWVMLSNTLAAVKYVDPVLIKAARTMDVADTRLFSLVILPAATPRLIAGARISLGVGFMVIVGAEMIGTVQGLGALITEARTFYRTDISLVGMVWLGTLGIAVSGGFLLLERRLVPWHTGLAGVRR